MVAIIRSGGIMLAGSEKKTVGEFLLDRLMEEGITEIFGIPGDYNFSLLDTIERYDGIRFINGRNELNAGYSADGYARVKGMAALITTFGVGEMSACNAVAGAYSENVPIIHIVGSPKSAEQKGKKLLHHTLMDGNYDVFRKVYEQISGYTAIVTPENAEMEIPRAIRIARETKKPVYIMVAIDLVPKQIISHKLPEPGPEKTNEHALKAALRHIQEMLGNSRQTAALVDMAVLRHNLSESVQALVEQYHIPAASLMQGKSGFDETHPQYIGMYGGAFGSDEVRTIIEEADCIIAAGLLQSDMNLSKYTAKLDPLKMIIIQPDSVQVGQAQYMNIKAEDLLKELRSIEYRQEELFTVSFPYEELQGEPGEPIAASSYYPRFQKMLREDDIVVVETGTFTYGMSQVRLPHGADYIGQGGWQSIGYAAPAAFGASMAAPDRRVVLFTGDGSLQLTFQEISSMLENGCKPIIFVLNNKGYTIEKILNVQTDEQKYNQIPVWQYTKLPDLFNVEAFTAEVRTNSDLETAIMKAGEECAERLCLIELLVEDPMDAPEYLNRLRSFLEEQKQQAEK
ncbi:alpha-keto acid decarboxylase family protein [Peribacillus deserti]|uniref:alpha-keto acid decarboxylase family protein n=1 Tax=Peribacillus deserti TaxID=673318 RepID=UPI003F8F68CA